ncbi:MAG: hypothetical protein A2784_01915 [Candidatus Chisholmbacteria bacterium RIFCSPHIGHO2_01_FULL_48_12]|uniref:Uncharacterized protein n=1 Tax=Candidatus Chisholmbacteria bacterium RIFCSPHIGHO2_01_FULL_48_12 TaxID=1797589 RepID=A0A1G1VQ31_9BACT|nr:MAG: hypothetical protein A2784_01915 [Candidatus Chisholmbacteria bacterium RIFCSPHIGHO2_01_FULL_48_12]
MNYLIILALVMIYEVGRVTLGLAVHPYRTMREVVRDRWEWPLMWVPGGLLIVSLIMSRVGARLVEVPEVWRNKLALILATVAMGLVLWQGMVGYLGWRFWSAGKNR